ncbi:hypothetical protein [Saccharothrix deserti]|uniref:hypothetical protein n=1 Tax=Saccharothrix deserti TaxID=2593674 RepID=UPI00131AB531|nr:hypothetical protein [Saccharothrix deserti]
MARRAESMIMARWWADQLRNQSWLKYEDSKYRSRFKKDFRVAALGEHMLRDFEEQLAVVFDRLLSDLGPKPWTLIGSRLPGHFDPVILEAAAKTRIHLTEYLFPSGACTAIQDGVVLAWSANTDKVVLRGK